MWLTTRSEISVAKRPHRLRTIWDGELRTATSTFTQLLSSFDMLQQTVAFCPSTHATPVSLQTVCSQLSTHRCKMNQLRIAVPQTKVVLVEGAFVCVWGGGGGETGADFSFQSLWITTCVTSLAMFADPCVASLEPGYGKPSVTETTTRLKCRLVNGKLSGVPVCRLIQWAPDFSVCKFRWTDLVNFSTLCLSFVRDFVHAYSPRQNSVSSAKYVTGHVLWPAC